MNYLKGSNSKSPLEEILIKKLLLSHDNDGRRLDSEQLLRASENIMLYATASQAPDPNFSASADIKVSNIEVDGFEDSLAHTILKISNEILRNFSSEANLHERTMSLFDLLSNYRWGDKAVLTLSALAKSYGEFWLLMQLYPRSPLAVSIVILKQLPSDVSALKRPFKALSLLMETVVDLIECVIKFERLPLSQVKLEDEAKASLELQIYSAVYWIVRSILTCSHQIDSLKALKPEQYSDSTTIATWELSSLVRRLKGMFSKLNEQVEQSSHISETKLYQRLSNIFKEEQKENQQVLKMLFASTDHFPLVDCPSQTKIGLSELENKVVILLISKPELFPIEDSLLLAQQLSQIVGESYEVVWIPISGSDHWTDSDKRSFRIVSRSLPWCAMKQPWLLNSAVEKFIRREWSCKDEAVMVVLDSNGNVTNSNAMDMVFMWGSRAFPFSASREEELWLEQKWTLQFLVDDIDPLLTKWVEEDRHICLYGSNNVEWVLELNSMAKEIENSGQKLEMVYIGKRKNKNKIGQHLDQKIVAKIEDGDIPSPLSFTKMQFFWTRLESMRRSKLVDANHVAREASRLMEMDEKGEDWAVIGQGISEGIARVDGVRLKQCLDDYLLSLSNESNEEQKLCEKCKKPMEKLYAYKPSDSEEKYDVVVGEYMALYD